MEMMVSLVPPGIHCFDPNIHLGNGSLLMQKIMEDIGLFNV